ncbi:hypothetical protein [Carbonactinospora thermoautotrophica]|uniref:biotin synthase auxiliary protein BsaP n=1 Tax=Carbonactinospora thermoautotrophica TaxID=1469144 RepID=UPI0022720C03|nr:hypothetical protein [Carbonactinospora thermoautotrophica]
MPRTLRAVERELVYCDHCGELCVNAPADAHARCRRMRELEPPRYCAQCRRRMVVQVTPSGWTARCAEHGVING